MKLAGAVLAFLAFLSAGICTARARKERVRALRELGTALELLQGELELRAAAIPELCAFLSERTEGSAKALMQELIRQLPRLGEEDFSRLWRRAVGESCGALQSREREELARLGEMLGRYELETQLLEIRACEKTLQRYREEAEQAYPGERRLSLGLCAAAGALLVLVLL